jgi:hypothetical protein
VQEGGQKPTLETTMFKGIAGQIALTLTLIVALPMALDAQKSGQIRVGVRIVRSVIPETQAATAAWLSQLAETGVSNMNIANKSVQTERGYAQITTESLAPTANMTPDHVQVVEEVGVESNRARVLMTVAYTAN